MRWPGPQGSRTLHLHSCRCLPRDYRCVRRCTRYIEPALLPEETKADCLLVPISDRGLVMGMDDALFFSHQLSPGLVIPIHYDGPKDRDRIDPEEFVTKAGQLGLRAQILSFGEEIEL